MALAPLDLTLTGDSSPTTTVDQRTRGTRMPLGTPASRPSAELTTDLHTGQRQGHGMNRGDPELDPVRTEGDDQLRSGRMREKESQGLAMGQTCSYPFAILWMVKSGWYGM